MRAERTNRGPVWASWIGVSALAGLAIGPVIAVVAAGVCAATLFVGEIGYRRRARAHFTALHRGTLARHDAVIDDWMKLRDRDDDRPSAQLADDVRRQPTARFITRAAQAADSRDLAHADDHPSVAAYDQAVTELERAWRRLELHAQGADLWGDARRWSRGRLPESVPAVVAPILPVARTVARSAWRVAEERVARARARDEDRDAGTG